MAYPCTKDVTTRIGQSLLNLTDTHLLDIQNSLHPYLITNKKFNLELQKSSSKKALTTTPYSLFTKIMKQHRTLEKIQKNQNEERYFKNN